MFRAEGLAVPIPTADYTMIKSLRLTNFRCFKSVEVNDLKRVNIVVGRNATGKTVLLESLFLAAGGSPIIVFNLRHMRGMGQKISVNNLTQSRLWEDLFYGFEMSRSVRIEAIGSTHDTRSLFISNVGVPELTVPTQEQPAMTIDAPIEFTWRVEGEPEFTTRPKVTSDGLTVDSGPRTGRAVMFPANFSLDPEETSKRLSNIRRKKEIDFLREALLSVFPDISDVSVEDNAGVWMVYISTPSVSSQMIPLALHSAGVNRFVACLLGIASLPRGVVLIDELENGLYYKILPDAWQAIYRFAAHYKTQVFVTTHSQECLSAAHLVVHKHPSDFSLIRAIHDGDQRLLDAFSGERLDGALESGFELR